MYNRLLWKLLGINIPVVASIMLVVWLAIDYLAADYFSVLMKEYHVSPDKAHAMFVSAIHRYLLWAILLGLAIAGILSFVLTRKVLHPLTQMMEITGKLADGDYGARVEVTSDDEIGRLGRSFNHMADSLQKIEQLRKTMVADAAHELRTPLTNVRGYLEALHDGVIPPSKETFATLQSEIFRLIKLSEDLLSLARADTAKQHLCRRPFCIRALVDEVLELTRLQLQSKHMEVKTQFVVNNTEVVADRDKVLQAVHNLVDNACQYSPENGTLDIRLDRIPEGIRLTMSNAGEGIARGDIPFIFERFYRADKSRSRHHGGSGIGLSIVKELIEAHGGTVGAASENGETRIWFTLPA